LDSQEDVKKQTDVMTKALSDMNSNLNRINAPNMKAIEK
jgi:hypothetical protein